MPRFIKKTLFTILTLSVITLIYFWYFKTTDIDQSTDQTPSPNTTIRNVEIPPFIITALQINENERQISQCTSQHCNILPFVTSRETPSVTDGESWYRYTTKEDKKTKQEKLVLERHWPASNSSQTIVEETDLTKPRDLIISPDGQNIAYWLDNVHEPSKKLLNYGYITLSQVALNYKLKNYTNQTF
jgi:hypothetical protein